MIFTRVIITSHLKRWRIATFSLYVFLLCLSSVTIIIPFITHYQSKEEEWVSYTWLAHDIWGFAYRTWPEMIGESKAEVCIGMMSVKRAGTPLLYDMCISGRKDFCERGSWREFFVSYYLYSTNPLLRHRYNRKYNKQARSESEEYTAVSPLSSLSLSLNTQCQYIPIILL